MLSLLAAMAGSAGPAVAAGNPYQRGPDPTVASIEASRGTFATAQINVAPGNGFGGGVVYYPTDTSQGTWGALAIVPGYTAKCANEEAWMGPWLSSFGFVVICIETNTTTDSDSQRAAELLAALNWLSTASPVKNEVDPGRLSVLGHSAGGAGAVEAAEQQPALKAMIGLAPGFPGMGLSMASDHVPSLIVGGQNDTVVTPSYLSGVYATMPASTQSDFAQIAGADHVYYTHPNNVEMKLIIPWLKLFVDDDTRYTQFLCPTLPDSSGVSIYQSKCPYVPPGGTPPPPYANLAASFNNVGITADNNTAPGSFDGNGASFSETALTSAKAGPGATVSASGVNFMFPNVAAGTNDNTVAEGQVITVSGSGTLGFLLASAYGPATGTGTITYTDGSTQSYTLTATDWWATTPGAGNTLAVSSAYQNRQGNTTANQAGDIFAETVPLATGKTVASVQLPAGGPIVSGSASLHIFAIATSGSGTGSNTVTVANPGAQVGTVGKAIGGVQVQGTDSASGQTLTYSATGLPAGLSISSSGLITGTPTAAGNSSVTVTATDGTGASGMATFTWTVSPAIGNTVTVANPGAQTGTVGTAITGLQVQGTDSASGQTLTYSATGLPAGLSISSSGLITGTPTAAGSSTVTVTATDGTGAAGSATFTWTVAGTTPGVCHVAYTKASEWPGGFTANVVITNTGTTAINGWTVGFTFPGDQKITNAWSATTTQTGAAVTATNVGYNASIAPGANTSFGFQGTFASNDSSPTSFTVNGSTCS